MGLFTSKSPNPNVRNQIPRWNSLRKCTWGFTALASCGWGLFWTSGLDPPRCGFMRLSGLQLARPYHPRPTQRNLQIDRAGTESNDFVGNPLRNPIEKFRLSRFSRKDAKGGLIFYLFRELCFPKDPQPLSKARPPQIGVSRTNKKRLSTNHFTIPQQPPTHSLQALSQTHSLKYVSTNMLRSVMLNRRWATRYYTSS